MATKELSLEIHGVRLTVRGPTDLIDETARDFAFFHAQPAHSAINIDINPVAPDSLHNARLSFGNSRWRVYRRADGCRLVTYPQGASCLCNYAAGAYELKTADPVLARELSYLLILSRAGEALDLNGLHRLHAGAVAFNNIPLLFCGNQGAGKTTLLLELLKNPAFALISDDTPLIGRDGAVRPFPLRFGLGANNPHLASHKDLRPFRRRYYPEKFLLDTTPLTSLSTELFHGATIFTLRKSASPRFTKMAKSAAWAELLKSLVLGWGVPQMAEYYLRLEAADIARKTGILASRLTAARALLSGCEQWIFETSPDPAANATALGDFLLHRAPAAQGEK